MKYHPSSWLLFLLGKIFPVGFAKRFVEVDKAEQEATNQIKEISEKVLSGKCNRRDTDKLRQKAQEGAREVLNGAA